MSYTIPNGDSLSFSFSGQPAYTPPHGDSLTFSFVPTAATGGPLALAARAALALIGQAHLDSMALKPLRAVGALSVSAIGIMRSLGTLMLKALGHIGLVGKRVAPSAPRGLGMKMHLVTDPKRADLVIDQFLRLWYWGLPSAVRVAYQVDDQPEIQPTAIWENPGTTQPAILRIDGAEIPGDGRTHRVTVSAWQQVGTATSPRASVSEYLSTPDVRPTAVPEWCGAELLRQATPYLADLSRVRWRHPGAVGIFVRFTEGLKTTLAQIGVADHQEEAFLAEGIALLIHSAIGNLNVYFGVAAVARNQYGPITWAVQPVKIPGFEEINPPTVPDPDRLSREALNGTELGDWVRDALAAQLGASAPLNLGNIVTRTQLKLWLRIKDIIRKGGTVVLDDLGTYKANWSPSGRSVSFVPSLGFKVGTAIGKPLTDAQAKAIP